MPDHPTLPLVAIGPGSTDQTAAYRLAMRPDAHVRVQMGTAAEHFAERLAELRAAADAAEDRRDWPAAEAAQERLLDELDRGTREVNRYARLLNGASERLARTLAARSPYEQRCRELVAANVRALDAIHKAENASC